MLYMLNNDKYDIYEILCYSFCSNTEIHGTVPTNRLLLLGRPDIDLRCIIFSYSWEYSKDLRNIQIDRFDGLNEKKEDYIVKTIYQMEIEKAIRESDEARAMMPAKKTNVTPRDTPNILMLPKASPPAHMSERTITACMNVCCVNNSVNQFIVPLI